MKHIVAKNMIILILLMLAPMLHPSDIFFAIQQNDLQAIHGIVAKDPTAVHHHKNHITPLLYALKHQRLEIFTYLLEHGACTHINGTSILQYAACHGRRLNFLKMILASGKLYDSLHIKTLDEPDLFTTCFTYADQPTYELSPLQNNDPTHLAWKQLSVSSEKRFALVQRGDPYICNYTDQELNEAGALLHFASPTKTSLYHKGAFFEPNDSEYKAWFGMNCPVTSNTLNIVPVQLLGCLALHQEFKKMLSEGYLTLDHIIDIQQQVTEIYEQMLIVRNTENYKTLLSKLIENRDYKPALTILKDIDTALTNHKTIWAPYVDEIRTMIKKLEDQHTRSLVHRFAILTNSRTSDTRFRFS